VPISVFDSITQLGPEHAGHVAVAASHGGVYAAYIAARGGVCAVVLNDAGRGLDDAGVAGLGYLDALGIPAAAIGHETARIGDGADMMRRGRLTGVNSAAARLGCLVGEACAEAAERLRSAIPAASDAPVYEESRFLLREGPVPVWGVDSAGLVRPDDAGAIVITGSHGALLGGRPETALRAPARAAVFHDAGIGIDRAGLSRLPALDARGIAAATVAGDSARIGDARSIWTTGRISAVNETARALGVAIGMDVPEFATLIATNRSALQQKDTQA
jgi:hypothetical protein